MRWKIFRFIIVLACLFGFSSASSHAACGHNTPILLNLDSYHSLKPYQQAIGGDIKLHLTLVFSQMSNEMIAAMKDPLEEALRKSAPLDNKLVFKEFGLLGNHVVAFYTPNWKPYQKFIVNIRRLVRTMAGQMGNLQYSQKNMVEYGRLGKDTVYTMDIRDPVPHVSLKFGGTIDEVKKLNALWQNGVQQAPKPITIRLNQIEVWLTRAIDL